MPTAKAKYRAHWRANNR
ncbi:hypothetical protein, partial [Escherichia coli]